MTLVRRPEYSTTEGQKDVAASTELSKAKVQDVCTLVSKTGLFSRVEPYEPMDSNLYISNSPAIFVDLPGKGRQLVIAPDIWCTFLNGDIMWIEVKDKPQRIYYPDTGCDIHQYIGFWSVNRYRQEPVLMMFIDPPLEGMPGLKDIKNNKVKKKFIQRWARFAPDGKPVFYGNWLSHLALYDERTRYPICRLERSRKIPMKIIYLHIDKMVPFPSINVLTKVLADHQDARFVPDFKVYDETLRRVVYSPDELF